MTTFVQQVLQAAAAIKTDRTELNVLAHTMEEVGELAEEITIFMGNSYKEPGVDGVIGEAVDAIITLFDLIYTHADRNNETITEEALIEIAAKKLAKWKRTAGQIDTGR